MTQCQGAGIGHVLIQDLVTLAKKMKLKKVFLEVRASNITAQGLYEKWQFQRISTRKRYYSVPKNNDINEREDAFIYLLQLS